MEEQSPLKLLPIVSEHVVFSLLIVVVIRDCDFVDPNAPIFKKIHPDD